LSTNARRSLTIAAFVITLVLGSSGVTGAAPGSPRAPASARSIGQYYDQAGGPRSFLGPAIGPEYATAGGGRARDFRGGSVYWSPATGAHAVYGMILARYRSTGGPAGPLGYPMTDETATPDGTGRFNRFSGRGSIYWTPQGGAHAIYGDIWSRWAAQGGERGRLGYPTTSEHAVSGGRRNEFSGGTITWQAGTRVTQVSRINSPSPPENPTTWAVNRADTYKVADVTGRGSHNVTDLRWNVHGTDLGHMFLHNGRIVMTFGDTFGGPSADPFFSVPHGDWRSNVMATVAPGPQPAAGLVFSNMIAHRPWHAKELLSSRKVAGSEKTVIPTYGVSVGNRMFLHYMSVRDWDAPGRWTLNHSGIAYSDDGGNTWIKDRNTIWPGNSNFGQVAFVPQGDYIYVYGIPGGRYGSLRLARVPAHGMLDKAEYQYWNGSAWLADRPDAAVDIVSGPVGELSVQYSTYYRQWLMMYLVDSTGQIVLRTADRLTGPWGPPQVVATTEKYPQAYAPYITPLWNDGMDIYFTMSMYGTYQVSLMHTSLTAAGPAGSPLPDAALAAPAPLFPLTPRRMGPYDHGSGSTP
jgi:hypothetical protein